MRRKMQNKIIKIIVFVMTLLIGIISIQNRTYAAVTLPKYTKYTLREIINFQKYAKRKNDNSKTAYVLVGVDEPFRDGKIDVVYNDQSTSGDRYDSIQALKKYYKSWNFFMPIMRTTRDDTVFVGNYAPKWDSD